MSRHERPLSPHLQIYKPQLTSLLSILHRLTGLGLVLSLFALSFWLYALSADYELFQTVMIFFETLLGKVAIALMLFVFFYHCYNGLRHLMWDLGKGLMLNTVYETGYFVLAITMLSTILVLLCIWFV